MSNELTEAEANKLFASVSANLGDPVKLDELLAPKEPDPAQANNEPEKVETVVEETKPAETPEKAVEKEPESSNEPTPVEPAPTETAAKAVEEEEVEALRRQLKLLEHKRKSDEGRVSAFQRKVNELEAKLAELSKNAKPPSAADATEDTEDEELKLLKVQDPTLYKIFKKREESHKQELAKLRQEVKQELAPSRQPEYTYAGRNESVDVVELEKLKTAIPNIGDVVNSEPFKVFRDIASPAVSALLTSKRADDVIQGVQLYSAWLVREGLVKAPAETTTQSPASSQNAEQIRKERERKLGTSVNVASPSSLPVRKEPTDEELFEAAFNHVINQHQNKR